MSKTSFVKLSGANGNEEDAYILRDEKKMDGSGVGGSAWDYCGRDGLPRERSAIERGMAEVARKFAAGDWSEG